VIESADEFMRLRVSDDPADYHRAAHEAASIDVWRQLIEDHPEMRRWVAHNKQVPLSILRVLARDSDNEVRWWVASKRKHDRGLFEMLAADQDPTVRHRIALNARTPTDIRERLACDADDCVRAAAAARLAGA
jgi:hypothetical protein